jgi:predicted secreted hydrolase
MRRVIVVAAGIALLALGAALVAVRRPAAPAAYSANVVDFLSDASGQAGFARVTAPRPIVFPADAGPHPAYQTEWWYYTGNLADAAGRRYGFQLTFFRRALVPVAPPRPSAWAASQVYLAHFTVTDVPARAFHSAERLARGAAGLAGAQADPFRVWVETWSATALGAVAGRVRLQAADGPVAIDLALDPTKPPALHGDRGFSRKGPQPGNASFYYSYPRLGATGVLSTATGTRPVTGTAWMDHEWSTSALATDQVGWDWFSLQLDDGRELMLFQIRQRDGGIAAESGGSLIGADGRVTPLAHAASTLVVTNHWTSPRTGGVYPAGWRVRVPGSALDLTVTPLTPDQELSTGLRYWEGAVGIAGTADGRPVTGHGYVELTGYAAGPGAGIPGVN